jgi:hypothetical protein
MAWRWWQNKQAEDREYATGESFPSSRPRADGVATSTPGTSSTIGTSGRGTGSASGMDSSIGAPVNRVPAQ